MNHGMNEASKEAVEHARFAGTPVDFMSKQKVFKRRGKAMLLDFVVEEDHVRVVIVFVP